MSVYDSRLPKLYRNLAWVLAIVMTVTQYIFIHNYYHNSTEYLNKTFSEPAFIDKLRDECMNKSGLNRYTSKYYMYYKNESEDQLLTADYLQGYAVETYQYMLGVRTEAFSELSALYVTSHLIPIIEKNSGTSFTTNEAVEFTRSFLIRMQVSKEFIGKNDKQIDAYNNYKMMLLASALLSTLILITCVIFTIKAKYKMHAIKACFSAATIATFMHFAQSIYEYRKYRGYLDDVKVLLSKQFYIHPLVFSSVLFAISVIGLIVFNILSNKFNSKNTSEFDYDFGYDSESTNNSAADNKR